MSKIVHRPDGRRIAGLVWSFATSLWSELRVAIRVELFKTSRRVTSRSRRGQRQTFRIFCFARGFDDIEKYVHGLVLLALFFVDAREPDVGDVRSDYCAVLCRKF